MTNQQQFGLEILKNYAGGRGHAMDPVVQIEKMSLRLGQFGYFNLRSSFSQIENDVERHVARIAYATSYADELEPEFNRFEKSNFRHG